MKNVSTILFTGWMMCLMALPVAYGQQTDLKDEPDGFATREKPVLVTHIIRLKHIEATEARETLAEILGNEPNVWLSAAPRTNALLLRTTQDQLRMILQLLETLDTPSPVPEELRTVQTNSRDAQEIANILKLLKMDSVDIAIPENGTLLLRGRQQEIQKVTDVIESISGPAPAKSQQISIEMLWLTESVGSDRDAFEGPIAERLKARGFESLFVQSEMQVAATTAAECEMSGAAAGGDIRAKIDVDRIDNEVSLTLDISAEYMVSGFDPEAAEDTGDELGLVGGFRSKTSDSVHSIQFETVLTTPLNQWIVFGVAQRRRSGQDEETRRTPRDLFLIRVTEQVPLM